VSFNETIYEGILEGNMKAVATATIEALAAGVAAGSILNEAMIPAMAEVGRLFEINEYYVPELLIAARAMKAGLEILKPQLVATGIEPKGKVVVGTVKGDLHDIGKNLVAIMVEGAGYEVIDLGVDVSPEAYVNTAIAQGAQVIGLSALLTTTMPSMKATVEALQESGMAGKIKVMIGGAPVTQKYADEIGADGYARDAAGAARLVEQLINS
jgi:5-methyltetrahydrofolate--homocysteine methyltransferase